MSLSLLVQGPYIICGYNKGFEGRQTTRFRTNSSWCRSVMESSDDGRLSAFDRSFSFFLIVLVIEFVPDLFSPFWKPCLTGDWHWTAYGVLNRLTRAEKLIFGDMFSTTLLTEAHPTMKLILLTEAHSTTLLTEAHSTTLLTGGTSFNFWRYTLIKTSERFRSLHINWP